MEFPNDNTKFKPGQSGNPNGRPKGARSLSTILREMLEEEIDVNIDGVKSRKQFQEVIIRKLLKKANDGDIRAIVEVFDRVEGKPKQEVDHKATIQDQRIDESKLTDDELRILAEIQRKSGIS